MSNTEMSTNYVYLLQQREFLKTKEDIFKVGMTTQENHERFKQYPKGSIKADLIKENLIISYSGTYQFLPEGYVSVYLNEET